MVTDDLQPQWQPISSLTLIEDIINGTLENTKEQYETLLPAREKPHVLDDALVQRVIRLYTEQNEDIPLYEEQLRRWENEAVTAKQRKRIARLKEQIQELRTVGEAILALADELKEGTIDKILAKDDAELGLEFLLGKLKS